MKMPNWKSCTCKWSVELITSNSLTKIATALGLTPFIDIPPKPVALTHEDSHCAAKLPYWQL